jgi:hypothetical protein
VDGEQTARNETVIEMVVRSGRNRGERKDRAIMYEYDDK